MKIMTCNIRVAGANDGEDNWELRKEFCCELIKSKKPDIVGFQEVQDMQFKYLTNNLEEYQSVGLCDSVTDRDPRNAIYFLKDKFKVITSGGYSLSEKPHVIGSKSWDSVCVRFANWVILVDKESNKEFRVLNTHLDHVGQVARENQARVICEDASAFNDDYPQILTGDMNCDTTNQAIKNFKSGGWVDTYGAIHKTESPGFTFHKFEGPEHQAELDKMDWIFYKGNVEVTSAEVIKDSNKERFPSDHYFISAEIKL